MKGAVDIYLCCMVISQHSVYVYVAQLAARGAAIVCRRTHEQKKPF